MKKFNEMYPTRHLSTQQLISSLKSKEIMYSGTFRAPDGTKGTFYCVKSKVHCEDSDDDEDRKPVQNMFVKNDNSALLKENEALLKENETLKKALLQQTKAEPTKPTKPKKRITLAEYIEKTQKEIKESTRKMNELHAKHPWLLQPDLTQLMRKK